MGKKIKYVPTAAYLQENTRDASICSCEVWPSRRNNVGIIYIYIIYIIYKYIYIYIYINVIYEVEIERETEI